MEGDFDSETQHRPPPPPALDRVCHRRSKSDASSLTVENCEDPVRHSRNVTPDESTTWTNEKHNSYLYHLEMSFVEQLYQSKSVLARCSGHNLRDINISRKHLTNASDQYGVSRNRCWQKSKHAAGGPTHISTHHSKHGEVHYHPSLSKVPTSVKLIMTRKQGEGMISHGTQTCSQDIIDSNREEMGQNFLDEDSQNTLNSESQAKRLKIVFEDGSHQDQIVPSK
ncbi:cold-regulated protein 28-like [Salvia splendens]|uniref:cold-regulated protein 28-like n=1 Tax=Salvia splendens TaxID=180675 RepID=UPI001C26DDFA|nr:cold-regulated protein 28-like [Salvia splendens]